MVRKLKIERTAFLTCSIICLIVLVVSGLDAQAMQAEITELQYQNSRQAAQLKDKQAEINMLEAVIKNKEQDASEPMATEPEYVGMFEITYYCPCTKCCGKTDGITASGTLAKEGQTVAADWDILFPGTKIYIDGIGFRTVEDKGGALVGQSLDVFMDSHSAALEAGRHKADVWIVEDVDV